MKERQERMKIQIKLQISKTKSNNQKQVRYVNGVKTYYKAGVWYCDYNHYQQIKRQQGINANIDVFISFCNR
ncbi:MAG: hypothetical protein WC123_07935, partial [Bacilli bacterium]